MSARAVRGLVAELRQLHRPIDCTEAVVDAMRESGRFTPGTPKGVQVCQTCVDSLGDHELWPCQTIRLAQRHARLAGVPDA